MCSSRHVLPVGVAEKSNAKNKFPVTFYIHNTYDKSITKQIEIFKVCLAVSLRFFDGYIVIVISCFHQHSFSFQNTFSQ